LISMKKPIYLSNYEIFPHKILKSRTFKKISILIVTISVLISMPADDLKLPPPLVTIRKRGVQTVKVQRCEILGELSVFLNFFLRTVGR